jgi:hypothetical protein
MAKDLKTAIVFFKPGTKRPSKYRNINNVVKFACFCQDLGAWYINWYNPKDRKFEQRMWLISNFEKKL